MEEFGMKLNWFGLMWDSIMGFRVFLIIKFLVIFDMVEVSEIGCRFVLKLEIIGVLGSGGILVSFYIWGILILEKEVFKMIVMGVVRILVYFFRI